MSHPFTLEYMQEGEIPSNHFDVDGTKLQEIQNESMAGNSQINSRPSTCDSNSLNDGSKTDPAAEDIEAMEDIKEEMNVTVTDNERVSFFKILRMAMRRRMEIFAEEVSIVGLTYLFKPTNHKIGSIIRKVIWTMLLLFGTGFMVFQIYDRISFYLTYPTIVNYQVAYNRSLRFPTVSICSEAFISKKAFSSVGRPPN
jgi:hypothetical protein